MKAHLCLHLVDNWLDFGQIKAIDTATPEHGHVKDKKYFRSTSKRKSEIQTEMLNQTAFDLRSQTITSMNHIDLVENRKLMKPDLMIYRPIPNREVTNLIFQGEWIPTKETTYFHPYLSMTIFRGVLTDYMNQSRFNEHVIHSSEVYGIHNLQGMTVIANKDSEMSNYYIYATDKFARFCRYYFGNPIRLR